MTMLEMIQYLVLIIVHHLILTFKRITMKKGNTTATNVRSTTSLNCQSKTVRDSCILDRVLLLIILLLLIAMTFSHYRMHKSKQKRINALTVYN